MQEITIALYSHQTNLKLRKTASSRSWVMAQQLLLEKFSGSFHQQILLIIVLSSLSFWHCTLTHLSPFGRWTHFHVSTAPLSTAPATFGQIARIIILFIDPLCPLSWVKRHINHSMICRTKGSFSKVWQPPWSLMATTACKPANMDLNVVQLSFDRGLMRVVIRITISGSRQIIIVLWYCCWLDCTPLTDI